MTEMHDHPEPWADVSLPAPFDAREIYEYATSVGADRRGQRRRRQIVLSVCSVLVVALTAAGLGLSGGGGGGQTSIQVAMQATIPRPAPRKPTVRAPAHHRDAAASINTATPAVPVAPLVVPQCGLFVQVTAFHSLPLPVPILDTTTTIDTTPTTTPPTTDTTPTTTPPTTDTTPTTTTPTTQPTTPPTQPTTPPTKVPPGTGSPSPGVATSGGQPPPLPSPLLLRPRRPRC